MNIPEQRLRFVPLEGKPFDAIGVYDENKGELNWKTLDIPKIGDLFLILNGPGKGLLRQITDLNLTQITNGWNAHASTTQGQLP